MQGNRKSGVPKCNLTCNTNHSNHRALLILMFLSTFFRPHSHSARRSFAQRHSLVDTAVHKASILKSLAVCACREFRSPCTDTAHIVCSRSCPPVHSCLECCSCRIHITHRNGRTSMTNVSICRDMVSFVIISSAYRESESVSSLLAREYVRLGSRQKQSR